MLKILFWLGVIPSSFETRFSSDPQDEGNLISRPQSSLMVRREPESSDGEPRTTHSTWIMRGSRLGFASKSALLTMREI
jgi:hypothetical protein